MNSFQNITFPKPAVGRLRGLLIPALALLAVIYVYFAGGYAVSVFSFALIYTIFVTGLNIFMGFTGQVSFGQNAFAAVSGYASAVLTATYGWEPLAAFGVGLACALLLALIVGYAVVRLKGHYLAMATLAIGLVTYEVAVQWDDVTAGYMGIAGIPRAGIGPWEISSDRGMMVLLAIVAALSLAAAAGIKSSRFGRALMAIAGSEEAAEALGIEVNHYKLVAFLIAAAFAALAGSLFAHFVGFVSPEVFGLHMVVLGFTMLFVGGIGTIVGPLLGAVIITAMPEVLRGLDEYQDLAYGAALILLLIYAPKGLASLTSLLQPKQDKTAGGAL